MITQSISDAREWIIQRCTQRWKGRELIYEDWVQNVVSMGPLNHVLPEDLLTREEMLNSLRYCAATRPDSEFRGHNAMHCSCPQHVILKKNSGKDHQS